MARAQALEWSKLGCHLGTLHQPLICSAAQWAHLETLGQSLFHRIDEGLNENALVVEGLNVRITKSMVDNYILMYLVFITESRVQEKWWHVFSIPVTELETQCESQMLLLPHWPCSHWGGLTITQTSNIRQGYCFLLTTAASSPVPEMHKMWTEAPSGDFVSF